MKRSEIIRESDVHFIKEYRHYKDSPDFRQIIFYARDQAGEILNNTILSPYQFNGTEHPIKALSTPWKCQIRENIYSDQVIC